MSFSKEGAVMGRSGAREDIEKWDIVLNVLLTVGGLMLGVVSSS
jgi:hypothetical protein